ncbi:hypothetical protein [Bacillus tuaregi]|uniref:hypothetical protein n=1 Tax=Bacillus tuaregi TaxID=1816695 RepID=UPI000A01B217|nr:hypothetical protein [Bacillus tuaregi]
MGKEQKHTANEEYEQEQSYDIQNESHIVQSGNSDVHVDINIEVDVTPIALALLYSLLADKKLTTAEFELAFQRIEGYHKKEENKHE